MLLARAVAVETPPASESDVGRSILNKAPEGCSVHPQVFYLCSEVAWWASGGTGIAWAAAAVQSMSSSTFDRWSTHAHRRRVPSLRPPKTPHEPYDAISCRCFGELLIVSSLHGRIGRLDCEPGPVAGHNHDGCGCEGAPSAEPKAHATHAVWHSGHGADRNRSCCRCTGPKLYT